MADYQSRNGLMEGGIPTNAVLRRSDNMIIGPEHEVEWAEYQAWLAAGNTPDPADPDPVYVPLIISDRQFFQQAAVAGIITQAEALAAVQTGTIPAMLQMIIDELPDANQRFAATMLLAGATQFERNHPLTVEVGTHLGLTTAQVDDFFIAAAQL